uniref:NudC domain-containing protein 1 n=1 Tax=Moina brachiata TaxID=675436 RepID=A0A4Y7NKH7_9CRUS|nr:EOG090X08S2 [Moina brachiata]SVE93097.1 EOG090X08S2 [Moina brachiata]
MAKLFELRPKKDLLDPTFEGYKLSLDNLPVYKHELPLPVENLKPSEDQFSFQHVKTFGLHNHLSEDPWNSDLAYFVAKDLQIFCIALKSLTSQHPEFHSVWKIEEAADNRSGSFNASLYFASDTLATVTDGAGKLFILDTGIRNATHPQQWQVVYQSPPQNLERPFKILHSYLNQPTDGNPLQLKVLLLKVEPLDEVETQIALSTIGCNEKETPFISCLELIELVDKNGAWAAGQLKRFATPFGIEYASVLSPGTSVCVIAREPFSLIYDSTGNIATRIEQATNNSDEAIYTWSESEDEVTVWMSFDKNTTKHDFVLDIQRQQLKVVFKSEIRLDGELLHSINVKESTWSLSDGKIEIILSKNDKSMVWSSLIVGDQRGQKVLDAESAAEWHQRLIHLTSDEMKPAGGPNSQPTFNSEQLEECDDASGEELQLFRFETDSNEATHKSMLGGHQLLFITSSPPGLAPSFCLRHDVDGLLWQPMGDELESWGCLHIAAVQAFGYIQASKEQRKFSVCPPNVSYAAICDSFNHVYIYRQPGHSSSTGVDLVHRPTGRKIGTVARQHVLNLDSTEECLGALASDNYLYILSPSSLFAVRVNAD